jgi:hypothetical protein
VKLLGIFGLIVILVVVALVVVDIATAPTTTKGQCVLDRRVILPDVCLNSCNPPFDCTRTTRPYAVFFTQAASCLDAVICG